MTDVIFKTLRNKSSHQVTYLIDDEIASLIQDSS